MSRVDCFSILF